eukprot:m.50414 g.50414  ORF g.50414 m.50414 type:complete len:355 (+) comp15135_c1_seq1:570-1634(+)
MRVLSALFCLCKLRLPVAASSCSFPTSMAATFRAIQVSAFGGPEVLKVVSLPALVPLENQILVKVEYAGVNPVETYMRSGVYARLPKLPYTPGTDGAGLVERVGEGITGVKAGDRVWLTGSLTGTYAQYCLCSREQVHRLPAHVGTDQGAALNIAYRTAYKALFQRGRAQFGQSVLVHGASGAVGVAVTQFARHAGLTIIGTAGTAAGLDTVKAQGAHYALNHKSEGYMDKVMEITSNRGVDIVIEMLANVNLAKDLTVLAHGGVVCVVGNRGEISINPRLLMQKESSVVGVINDLQADDNHPAVRAINSGLEAHTLKPVVGRVFALEEAPAAHTEVIEHAAGSTGKIVIAPWK